MDKLNFYTIPNEYVEYLQKEETEKRGFSRVPNLKYGKDRKPKFLCGIVLNINDVCYFAPVTSYKEKKSDNFLIYDKNNKVTSSLRFNYMIPVPTELLTVISIQGETDTKYRTLLSQELRWCIKHKDVIKQIALRTYKRVLLGKDKGLVYNSCDFQLLEQKSLEYNMSHSKLVLKDSIPLDKIPASDNAVRRMKDMLKDRGIDFVVKQNPETHKYTLFFKETDLQKVKAVIDDVYESLEAGDSPSLSEKIHKGTEKIEQDKEKREVPHPIKDTPDITDNN